MPDNHLEPCEATEENFLFSLAEELFPINRSLTGEGVRDTLDIVKRELPGFVIHSVPSRSRAFDWTVPDEWNVGEAYIIDPSGKRIADFAENNLHLVGYSIPIECELSREKLLPHLFSREDMPEVIPYVTSYYEPNWGFCITHSQKQALPEGNYKVRISSSLEPGYLNYGELVIPGENLDQEILITSYICHPSMANNELSGPVALIGLARWLTERKGKLKNTFRFVLAPETIGALVYLQENLEHLKAVTKAGFVVTCVGDERAYSYLSSPYGDNLSDQVLTHVLTHFDPDYKRFTFLERGSDERQYCAPGIDLPMCGFSRSKYGEYPEYHTSADNLSIISGRGLRQSVDVLRECVLVLEKNRILKNRVLGEPQLGRRGLYSNLAQRQTRHLGRQIADVLAYSDGQNTTLDLANRFKMPFRQVDEIIEIAIAHDLIE